MENISHYKGEFYDIPELKLCPAPSKPVPISNWGSFKACLKKGCKSWRWLDKRWIKLRGNKNLIDQINDYQEMNLAH